MTTMINFLARKPRSDPSPRGHSLARLEFEMALEIGDNGEQDVAETVRNAAHSAGGDFVFMLPAPGGKGFTAMVRLVEDGSSHLLQVRTMERGFAIAGEGEIAAEYLGFARASIEVLERLRADRAVTSG